MRGPTTLLERSSERTMVCRNEARRFLIRLVDEQKFHLAIFLARKLARISVITQSDLDFFVNTICTALKNGFPDVMKN